MIIPESIDYDLLPSLSTEIKTKLKKLSPSYDRSGQSYPGDDPGGGYYPDGPY